MSPDWDRWRGQVTEQLKVLPGLVEDVGMIKDYVIGEQAGQKVRSQYRAERRTDRRDRIAMGAALAAAMITAAANLLGIVTRHP